MTNIRAPILAALIYAAVLRGRFLDWIAQPAPGLSIVRAWVHDFTDLFFAIAGVALLALIAFAPDLLPHR